MTTSINEHQVYQYINDIPPEMPVKGNIFRRGAKVRFNSPDSENHNKVGFINNILYAPCVDHYYQRIRVNVGNYTFVESASRFWESSS